MTDASPEVLSKLADMIKAATTGGTPHAGTTFLEYLKGWTEFLGVIAWPAATVVCVLLFRRQIIDFLGGVETVKVFGAEISRKIDKQIEQSAKEALTKSEAELRSGPSKGELDRAMVVKELTADRYGGLVAAQAQALAAEYERVRASMPPSNERTRAMEVVVSKMRTIGQAFFPIRHEFAVSASPGKRLMVIASLQVLPDYEMLDWLAQRVGSEKPFLQYQALVATLLALQGSNAGGYIQGFDAAIKVMSRFKDSFGGDTSRVRTLERIETSLDELKRAAQTTAA